MLPIQRRDFLRTLLGGSAAALPAFATGIPLQMWLNPRTVRASSRATAITKPQFVLFSTSAYADPINANAPGTYEDPRIVHPSDPATAAANISFGGSTVRGGAVWNTLPAAMLAKTCFFHHSTKLNAHTDTHTSLKVAGQVKQNEMLPSMLATHLGPALQAIRAQPLNFNLDGLETLVFQGQVLPALTPATLAASLSLPGAGGLADAKLVALRDASLDKLHAWAKQSGTSYQRAYIDQYALSQTQVRTIQDKVLAQLAGIRDNSFSSQIKAALVLFKMKVTPVAMVHANFGGDNHTDANFTGELNGHKDTLAILATLPQLIATAGLQDQVTFAIMNVFGRTLAAKNSMAGRDHNSGHSVGIIYGRGVNGGVVGGVKADTTTNDYSARGIASLTGMAVDGGDIAPVDTFASLGRTISACCGLPADTINDNFLSGQIVTSAVAS